MTRSLSGGGSQPCFAHVFFTAQYQPIQLPDNPRKVTTDRSSFKRKSSLPLGAWDCGEREHLHHPRKGTLIRVPTQDATVFRRAREAKHPLSFCAM